MSLNDSSTEFSVKRSGTWNEHVLAFLSRLKKVCTVNLAIIKSLLCPFQIFALTIFCVMFHCHLDLLPRDVTIHKINA